MREEFIVCLPFGLAFELAGLEDLTDLDDLDDLELLAYINNVIQ